MTRFCRYELRTTDVEAARAFYAAVIGDAVGDVTLLPAESQARGARPAWLGHLGVDDVEGTAGAFVARGAIRLGRTRASADGGAVAILRDPGGAVVALATPPLGPGPGRGDVVWHLLNTTDVTGVMASYGALFGWSAQAPLDLGSHGVHHPFAWQSGGPLVGAMADVAGRPGVHPHWLFHFRVRALEPALVAVRDGGGLVVGPFALPGGGGLAVCDDPQGAAFALRAGP
jgi:predicted enzyme related to lactoylglutathione lyase